MTIMIAIGAQRWWALGAVTLAVLTVGMDLTILSSRSRSLPVH